MNAVDQALSQERLLCRVLSQVCGRRIYLSSHKLALLLQQTQQILSERAGFQLLCLPEDMFSGIGMELGVWGNEAAIAWLGSGQSTACKDYPNVSALHGFCTTIFQKASEHYSSQHTAETLNIWLRCAKKMRLL